MTSEDRYTLMAPVQTLWSYTKEDVRRWMVSCYHAEGIRNVFTNVQFSSLTGVSRNKYDSHRVKGWTGVLRATLQWWKLGIGSLPSCTGTGQENRVRLNQMRNHYNVLEVDKNCTAEEIKDSYIKLSKKYHPDKNKSKEAQKKIVEINEAYSILKNKSTRCQYDETLQQINTWQQQQHNVHQNRGEYYHNRPNSYDEYVRYYEKMRNSQEYVKPAFKQFNVVVCCCMLMMFGAGLRIMYAWSEAHQRRIMNEIAAKDIARTKNTAKNSKLEKFELLWKHKKEREVKEKSES